MVLNKLPFVGLSVAMVFMMMAGVVGCDQISSMMDSITRKDAKKTTSTAAVASSTAQATIPEPSKPNGPLAPDVLARVGDWSITINEFNEKLKKLKEILPEFDPTDAKSKKLILEELIRQELLVKDAEQTGVAQKKEIVDTVADFRKTLLVQEVATELTKGIEVAEGDAREYYDKNTKEFVVKPEWKIREIMVATESEAKDILVLLLQGADFAETAAAKSKAPTAAKGGDKGLISKFPFEQMQAAAASLDAGKVSSVFKGPDGFYIIKLDEKKGGEPKSFASLKGDLIKGLTLRKQQEAVLDHLNKLASKASIQVNEDLLK